nr:FAD-dependent oxidoreductase [Microbacterium sp. MAH-37]
MHLEGVGTVVETQYDVIVVGGGVGGVCGALAAARSRVRVLLVEAAPAVGGTGVFSSVSLICDFRDDDGRPINNGIHRELFPEAYLRVNPRMVPTYDEQALRARYEQLLAAEPTLTVWTGTRVAEVRIDDGRVEALRLEGDHEGWISASAYLDATADGNLAQMAGADFWLGREQDGLLQSATATFKVSGFDPELLIDPRVETWDAIFSLRRELLPYYRELKDKGLTSNPREDVTCFPYPGGKSLLFNSTSVLGVDPTRPETVRAGLEEGEKQARELFAAITRHPAFADATLDFISPKLGVREGRRIVGDYELTGEDCLSCRRFDDMIAAGGYDVDVHNPEGGKSRLTRIPSPGYYHIPLRSLIPRGLLNVVLSSRCISGSYEAHASYRVMSSISGVGEAAGVTAALMHVGGFGDVREVDAAAVRYVLQMRGQFVEGRVEPVELPVI